MGPNTFAIWMAEPLQYLLITVKVVALEKVSFSDTQNPKTVFQHIDIQWQALSAYWRQFNAKNSDDFISKTKTFFQIFFCILKIYIKI